MVPMTVMAMTIRINPLRFALAVGIALTGASAHGQATPPTSGVSYDPPAAQAQGNPVAPVAHIRRANGEIRPYLEVSQVVSTELDGGETLTYTNLAAGVDGRISTRRVRAAASYRYDRRIEWG